MNEHSWNLEERALAEAAVRAHRVTLEVQRKNRETDAAWLARKPEKCPCCGAEPMSWDDYCAKCYAHGC